MEYSKIQSLNGHRAALYAFFLGLALLILSWTVLKYTHGYGPPLFFQNLQSIFLSAAKDDAVLETSAASFGHVSNQSVGLGKGSPDPVDVLVRNISTGLEFQLSRVEISKNISNPEEKIGRRKHSAEPTKRDVNLHQNSSYEAKTGVRKVQHSVVETDLKSETKCDIYLGKWVFDPTYPIYDSASCPFIDEGFRCQEHGRPDKDYTKWRWQPTDCDLPRFNATQMLQKLRNKRIVFAGDSIGRNQWESLVCMLYQGVTDKSKVYEVRRQKITKSKGDFVVKFEEYNAKVEYYRSHFLAQEGKRPAGAPRRIKSSIRLDRMDSSAQKWRGADVLVYNSAHWWDHGEIVRGKCSFIEGDMANSSMDMLTAYSKAMKYWANWVDSQLNSDRVKVFFRGFAPAHFHGGQWNTGGNCHLEKEPIFNETDLAPYPKRMKVMEEILAGMKTPVSFLNITRLSEYRKEAHIAIWQPGGSGMSMANRLKHQDCSHWCLPGVPDTWNELLYFELLRTP